MEFMIENFRLKARNNVRRSEGSLLDLGEEVVGIPVQFEVSDLDQRIVRVRPYLRDIEWMDMISSRSLSCVEM